jgi:hypothetical protein
VSDIEEICQFSVADTPGDSSNGAEVGQLVEGEGIETLAPAKGSPAASVTTTLTGIKAGRVRV